MAQNDSGWLQDESESQNEGEKWGAKGKGGYFLVDFILAND